MQNRYPGGKPTLAPVIEIGSAEQNIRRLEAARELPVSAVIIPYAEAKRERGATETQPQTEFPANRDTIAQQRDFMSCLDRTRLSLERIAAQLHMGILAKLHVARRNLLTSTVELNACKGNPEKAARWETAARACLDALSGSFNSLDEIGETVRSRTVTQRAKTAIMLISHLAETKLLTGVGESISGPAFLKEFGEFHAHAMELAECLTVLERRLRETLDERPAENSGPLTEPNNQA